MADAPKILGKDSLRQAYPKLNSAIDNSNEALKTANTAKSTADSALSKSDSAQKQIDTLVIKNGQSDAEVLQSRVKEDGTTFPLLKDRLNDVDNQFIEQADYGKYPQSPKPPKSGIQTCSPKIIHKTTSDELQIIQKTNKGYVHYTFAKNNGASDPTRDYGTNHELIRIIRARHIQDAYVYKDISSPFSGTLTEYNTPNLYNTIETLLFHTPQRDDTKSISSKGNGYGMGVYQIAASSEVVYELNATPSKRANIVFMCSAGGSQDVQIFVNNILVKSFNPRSLVFEGSSPNGVAVIDFEIPANSTTQDKYKIKIRNNSASGNAYPCAINFFELKDYKNQDITDYKCFGSTKSGWIENSGASDYALYDEDAKKWFGSYHGGEISEYDRVLWNTSGQSQENDYYQSLTPFSNIAVNEWRVQKQFNIYQQTSLAGGKAKMVSNFDFDIDGTIEMDFGYYDGTVNLSNFYTALTCTATNFAYLFYPRWYYFGSTPTNGVYTFPITEGKISQVSAIDVLQLDIRFTKFNNKNDTRGATISDNDAYRKFYYGVVYGKNKILNSLSFSKGLDFIVR